MNTETIDKLFLELSQVTQATTLRERGLTAALDTECELRKAAEANLETLVVWLRGDGGGWPLSGTAYEIRQLIEKLKP